MSYLTDHWMKFQRGGLTLGYYEVLAVGSHADGPDLYGQALYGNMTVFALQLVYVKISMKNVGRAATLKTSTRWLSNSYH